MSGAAPREVSGGGAYDLTVVIVNYNVRYFLEQCLHSVGRASSGLRVEIIVVDNNLSPSQGRNLEETT